MYGLNIDPNNPRGNPEPAELLELGVETVRYTFYDSSGGDQPDPAKARFYSEKAQAYHQAGIESLVILTYDTYPNPPSPDAPDPDWDRYIEKFARRAAQIAQLLAPWQPAFQVWNEPDHPVKDNYRPTLREAVFGRMLRQTYQAIKSVTPAARVLTAGLAMGNPGWLTRVIQSQGGRLPADILAFHPYGQRPDPNWPHPNWAFGYVGDLLAKYYRAGQGKPVWITEMGVKEEDLNNNRDQVAEFLHRYYRTMTTRYSDKVQKLIWFCYSDGMVPPFGLVDAAGNRKPAYYAFLRAAAYGPSRQPVQPVAPAQPVVSPPPAPPISAPVSQPAATRMTPPPPPPISPTPVSAPLQPAQPAAPPDTVLQELNQLTQQILALQSQMQQIQARISQLQSQLAQYTSPTPPTTPVIPPVTTPPAPVAPTGKPAPAIQNITNQLKRHPQKQFPTRPLSQIQLIVIHHTAIDPNIGADRIANYGVDKLGWAGFRYHYFITGNAAIQQTNELTTLTDHAGAYSAISIGVGFAGNFMETVPAPAQIEAGAQLLAWLIRQLNLSLQAVVGYKELINTQSPGDQWDGGQRWGARLKQRIQAYL